MLRKLAGHVRAGDQASGCSLRSRGAASAHAARLPATRRRPAGALSIESACDWELNLRAGHDYELLPPEAAIAQRATFAQDSPGVRAFLLSSLEAAHRRRAEPAAPGGVAQCKRDPIVSSLDGSICRRIGLINLNTSILLTWHLHWPNENGPPNGEPFMYWLRGLASSLEEDPNSKGGGIKYRR